MDAYWGPHQAWLVWLSNSAVKIRLDKQILELIVYNTHIIYWWDLQKKAKVCWAIISLTKLSIFYLFCLSEFLCGETRSCLSSWWILLFDWKLFAQSVQGLDSSPTRQIPAPSIVCIFLALPTPCPQPSPNMFSYHLTTPLLYIHDRKDQHAPLASLVV